MAEAYDLKRCPHCNAHIPATATMCAQCGSSKLEGVAPPLAPGLTRKLRKLSVTTVLVWANLAFFIASLLVQWRLTPEGSALEYLLPGPSGAALDRAGCYLHGRVAEGEWWRVLTAAFLHAGLIHIGFNMYVLLRVGALAEQLLGRAKFLVVYLTGAICSSLALSVWFVHVLGGRSPAAVGASGAVFALLGVLVTFLRRKGDAVGRPYGRMLALNAAVLLLLGFYVEFVSNTGHVGGLVPGLVFGLYVGDGFAARLGSFRARMWAWLAVVLAALTVIALGLGVAHAVRRL